MSKAVGLFTIARIVDSVVREGGAPSSEDKNKPHQFFVVNVEEVRDVIAERLLERGLINTVFTRREEYTAENLRKLADRQRFQGLEPVLEVLRAAAAEGRYEVTLYASTHDRTNGKEVLWQEKYFNPSTRDLIALQHLGIEVRLSNKQAPKRYVLSWDHPRGEINANTV